MTIKQTAGRANLVVIGKPLEFDNQQVAVLQRVCPDPTFAAGVKKIAENYADVRELYRRLSTAAEDREALDSLGAAILSLQEIIADLPLRVNAYLHRVDSPMRTLQRLLPVMLADIARVAPTVPAAKRGRPQANAKREAARMLRDHFGRFGLEWSVKGWNAGHPDEPDGEFPAIDALAIVFVAGDSSKLVKRSAVVPYVKKYL